MHFVFAFCIDNDPENPEHAFRVGGGEWVVCLLFVYRASARALCSAVRRLHYVLCAVSFAMQVMRPRLMDARESA